VIDEWWISCSKIAKITWLKANKIARNYLNITSDFAKNKEKYEWIAKSWTIIKENIWTKLCLDEVDLWGQYYTILSNVEKPKWIIAVLPWTKAEPFIKKLKEVFSSEDLNWVKEVSSDMSKSMEKILKELFPNAEHITDRFHYMKEILDDLQTERKNLKTEFKKIDNEERVKEKEAKKKWENYIYEPRRSCIWETFLEMITICMYQCNTRMSDRNNLQKYRYKIMKWLSEFDSLTTCIDLIQNLFNVLDSANEIDRQNLTKEEIKNIGASKLKERMKKAEKNVKKCKFIWAMIATTKLHFDSLSSYFLSMHSTAYAEWLHSRIRELIQNVRWFKNKDFMIYRIIKMFS